MFSDLFDGHLEWDGSPEELQTRSAEIPSERGVVLFTDGDGVPVQLLMASHLRRTTLAKLAADPNQPKTRKARLNPVVRSVYFRRCGCEFGCHVDFLPIAKRLYGRRYRKRISLPKTYLIQIDLSHRWPQFSLASHPATSRDSLSRKTMGLFPGRKAAVRTIDVLVRAFGLCQRPDLIDSSEQARSCPYLQMETCPAPCVGGIPREEYIRQLNLAVEMASGKTDAVMNILNETMKCDATAMRFEQAARTKRCMDQLREFQPDWFRWMTDVSEMSILHVDRSFRILKPPEKKKFQTFSAYLIYKGLIYSLDDFEPETVSTMLHQAQSILSTEIPSHLEQRTDLEIADSLSLVSSFLFRSHPPGFWWDCRTGLPEPELIHETVGRPADPEATKPDPFSSRQLKEKNDVEPGI